VAAALVEEYHDQLKSEIADFTNTGGRPQGLLLQRSS
jgi:leucyl aminopeptidase